jgi:UDP-N-acetylmuramoylalanine--D-glutamate ligase
MSFLSMSGGHVGGVGSNPIRVSGRISAPASVVSRVGGSCEPLVEALRERGRAVVLIGEASDLIAKALGDAVPHVRALTMDDAVKIAADLAKPGDAVLLSPACSSFDMFADYKERGDAFVGAVEALP